ncbi:hypothetical protein KID03_09180 [bacterium]|nr:hypothetical protein [bacterium]
MNKSLQFNIIKSFLFIILLFLFLPAFYVPEVNIPFYAVAIGVALGICLISFRQSYIFSILNLLKYNYFRVLIFFILWVIFVGFLFVALGKYPFYHFLYATFLLLIYTNLSWYLLPALIIPNVFSLKFFIKFLFLGIYLICIYGLLVYLFNILGINLLNYIQDIINNRREEIVSLRVLSVFEEPSNMGSFLCANLPLLYTLILSKYKIFQNNFLDIFIKRTYIPLLVITIIFIQSPIWLIFFSIVTLIYFSKKIIKVIKRRLIPIFIILLIVLSFFSIHINKFNSVDVSKTFLQRIVNVTQTMTDWNTLVIAEPSLANRLLSYTSRAKLFIKYPLTGVGYKNTEYNIYNILNTTKLSLTKEISISMLNSYDRNRYVLINGSILWILLSDTGLIGTFLFYLFIIFCIQTINKYLILMPECIENDFFKAIRNSYIAVICLSIYDININIIYWWFLYGFVNVIMLKFIDNTNTINHMQNREYTRIHTKKDCKAIQVNF